MHYNMYYNTKNSWHSVVSGNGIDLLGCLHSYRHFNTAVAN